MGSSRRRSCESISSEIRVGQQSQSNKRRLLGSLSLAHGGGRVEGVGAVADASAVDTVRAGETSLAGLASLDSAGVVAGKVLVVRELAALEVKRRVVALAQSEHVEERKDGLGEQVKDTVEDHLTVRRDGVASVCQSPCDLAG